MASPPCNCSASSPWARIRALGCSPPSCVAACSLPPLAGLAEVDETELPGRNKNDPLIGGRGRSRQGKILVVGAVEVQDGGAGPGRLRLEEIPDYSAASLHAFLAAHLAPGATAKTDGLPSYAGVPSIHHDPHVIGKMAAHIVLPWVHRVFSNLKVWALGVYHGLRRKHLQSYAMSSSSASTAAAPAMPPSAPSRHQNVDLTGSKSISLNPKKGISLPLICVASKSISFGSMSNSPCIKRKSILSKTLFSNTRKDLYCAVAEQHKSSTLRRL
jgi:ISXO2 transposase-like protein